MSLFTAHTQLTLYHVTVNFVVAVVFFSLPLCISIFEFCLQERILAEMYHFNAECECVINCSSLGCKTIGNRMAQNEDWYCVYVSVGVRFLVVVVVVVASNRFVCVCLFFAFVFHVCWLQFNIH